MPRNSGQVPNDDRVETGFDIDSTLRAALDTLSTSAPPLPTEEVTTLIKRYIEKREIFLRLRSKEGSPLYIVEEAVLRSRARVFTEAFRTVLPDVRIYFAVKSNSHSAVTGILIEEGLGLDVSSGVELDLALQSDTEDILFSGPGKTVCELRHAVQNRSRVTILIDSFSELRKLQEIAAAARVEVDAGVRLAIDENGPWRKFGIPLRDLRGFLSAAKDCDCVRIRGLQFHTSWNLNPTNYVAFIRTLAATLRDLPRPWLSEITFFDIGGGFWPPQGEWLTEAGTLQGKIVEAVSPFSCSRTRHYRLPAVPIAEFARRIADALRTEIFPLVSCRICMEPGRWICNDAMHLLMTVVDKKAEDLVITDAGTNAVGWEKFEENFSPVINLSQPDTTEHECYVLGSLCTPHDVWGYTYSGSGIGEKDVLLIPNQGAYTYSLRQRFIKPPPQVVVLPG